MIKFISIIWISLFLLPIYSFSQTQTHEEKIDGYCDHIIVTIPGMYFDSLIQIFETNLPNSTVVIPGNSKSFIIPEKTAPYVEFWNSSSSLYTGSQIAFGSNEEMAIAKAKKYYGYNGEAYGELFTVGGENSSGHPYGGNFFVSYGKMDISNPNDSIEVHRLKEIKTLLPITKSSIKDDYRFYNLDIEEKDSAFSTTDTNQTVIYTKLSEGNVIGNNIGHVSLSFELTDSIFNDRKVINLGDSVQFIFDKKTFILILMKSQFDQW